MKLTVSFHVFVFLVLGLGGCGGGGYSQSSPPPSSSQTEVLYARNLGSVSSYSIDPTTGSLSPISSQAAAEGTGSLSITSSGTFLYAIEGLTTGIDAFNVSHTGSLGAVAGSPFPVPEPNPGLFNSLAVDNTGRFLFIDDTGRNQVIGFTIGSGTGALSSIPGGSATTGVEPQQIAIDPTSKFLYTANQGDGTVSAFNINSSTGELTAVIGSPFTIIPTNFNTQPQAIAVHQSGKFLYVALFNANGLAAFSVDGTSGALTMISGSPFSTGTEQITQTTSVAIHPTGKFLYTLNFVDGTVYGFAIDQTTGVLTAVPNSPFSTSPVPGFGSLQGPLAISPSGKFLYAATNYQYISGFAIDATTGSLKPLQQSPLPVPLPAVGLTAGPLP